MLSVTVADVAAYAPGTFEVTGDQLQEALDWVSIQLARHGISLEPATAQERNAERAAMAYAVSLNLQSGMVGHLTGLTAERKKLGDVEVNRQYADGASTAAGYASTAAGYLRLAWLALFDAGVQRGRSAIGVSR